MIIIEHVVCAVCSLDLPEGILQDVYLLDTARLGEDQGMAALVAVDIIHHLHVAIRLIEIEGITHHQDVDHQREEEIPRTGDVDHRIDEGIRHREDGIRRKGGEIRPIEGGIHQLDVVIRQTEETIRQRGEDTRRRVDGVFRRIVEVDRQFEGVHLEEIIRPAEIHRKGNHRQGVIRWNEVNVRL